MLAGAKTNAVSGSEGNMACCDGMNMHKLILLSFYLPWTPVDFGQFHHSHCSFGWVVSRASGCYWASMRS